MLRHQPEEFDLELDRFGWETWRTSSTPPGAHRIPRRGRGRRGGDRGQRPAARISRRQDPRSLRPLLPDRSRRADRTADELFIGRSATRPGRRRRAAQRSPRVPPPDLEEARRPGDGRCASTPSRCSPARPSTRRSTSTIVEPSSRTRSRPRGRRDLRRRFRARARPVRGRRNNDRPRGGGRDAVAATTTTRTAPRRSHQIDEEPRPAARARGAPGKSRRRPDLPASASTAVAHPSRSPRSLRPPSRSPR